MLSTFKLNRSTVSVFWGIAFLGPHALMWTVEFLQLLVFCLLTYLLWYIYLFIYLPEVTHVH